MKSMNSKTERAQEGAAGGLPLVDAASLKGVDPRYAYRLYSSYSSYESYESYKSRSYSCRPRV